MGLFDYFTNDAQQQAAADQTAGINAGIGQFNNYSGTARDQLTNYFGQAQGAIGSGVGAGNAALSGNYSAGIGSLTGNYGAGVGALNSNYGAGIAGLTDAFQQGIQPSQGVFNQASQGANQYGNALGLNGPQGNAAATAGFWNNPGIQAQLDIGSENVLRNQARTGQLSSGKTNVDLQNYGQQVASQGWNNYVSQLQPYLNQQSGAAANIGNLYSGYGSNLAGQYANLGNQSAGLYSGLGNQLAGQYGQLGQGLNQNAMQGGQLSAGLYQGLGTGLANNYTNQGQAAYGAQTSIGNANANADLAAATASGNIWNTAIGAASALAGAPSGLMKSASNFGSGIANTFGSGSGTGTGYAPSNGFNWSDVRIKDGIEKLTELADGTNVYRFRYKGDPTRTTHIGLMAQEVEKTNPDAVIEIGGIKAVDYGRATDRAAAIMKLAA